MGIPLAPLRFTKGEGPLCPSDISHVNGGKPARGVAGHPHASRGVSLAPKRRGSVSLGERVAATAGWAI